MLCYCFVCYAIHFLNNRSCLSLATFLKYINKSHQAMDRSVDTSGNRFPWQRLASRWCRLLGTLWPLFALLVLILRIFVFQSECLPSGLERYRRSPGPKGRNAAASSVTCVFDTVEFGTNSNVVCNQIMGVRLVCCVSERGGGARRTEGVT